MDLISPQTSLHHSDLLQQSDSSNWFETNVSRPAAQALLADVFVPGKNAFDMLSGKGFYQSESGGVGSVEARPQNAADYLTRLLVSGGIAAATYVACGRVAGGALRAIASNCGFEGTLARVAGSEFSGQVAGAAAHDFFLNAKDDRSRAANVLSGVATFGTYEGLNRTLASKSLLVRGLSLAPIGATGATLGYLTHQGVSGEKFDPEALKTSIADGAILNALLPATQHATGRIVDTVNVSLGRGVPIEREIGYQKLAGKSPSLDKLFHDNYMLRIQPVDLSVASINHLTNLVKLPGKNSNLPTLLGHEIAHKEAVQKFEEQFKLSSALLSKNETAAREVFIAARQAQEQHASCAEQRIMHELKSSGYLPESFHFDHGSTDSNLAYLNQFSLEFEQFKAHQGQWRPDIDYGHLGKGLDLDALKQANNSREIVSKLYDVLPQVQQNALSDTLERWKSANPSARSAFDLIYAVEPRSLRQAYLWTALHDYVSARIVAHTVPPYLQTLSESKNFSDFKSRLDKSLAKENDSISKHRYELSQAQSAYTSQMSSALNQLAELHQQLSTRMIETNSLLHSTHQPIERRQAQSKNQSMAFETKQEIKNGQTNNSSRNSTESANRRTYSPAIDKIEIEYQQRLAAERQRYDAELGPLKSAQERIQNLSRGANFGRAQLEACLDRALEPLETVHKDNLDDLEFEFNWATASDEHEQIANAFKSNLFQKDDLFVDKPITASAKSQDLIAELNGTFRHHAAEFLTLQQSANEDRLGKIQAANNRFAQSLKFSTSEIMKLTEEFASSVGPDGLPLKFIPPSVADSALASALTFENKSANWFSGRIREAALQRKKVDIAIPLSGDLRHSVLADQLLKNSNAKAQDLILVANQWKNLPESFRTAPGSTFHDSLDLARGLAEFPSAKVPCLAAEAARGDRSISEEEYALAESSYLKSLNVPEPFPTDLSWQSGKYVASFLPRSDYRRLFIGNHTNSCMRIGGQNDEGIRWVQTAPLAGVFAIQNRETSQIIAASRVWTNEAQTKICFNSIQSKGAEGRDLQILDLFQQAARHLVDQGASLVTVGTLNSKVDLSSLRPSRKMIAVPPGMQGMYDCHEDQRLLAEL